MLHTVSEKYTAHWEPRRCWYSINFCRGPKRVRTLVKRTCISQETNRTMAKDECGQETWNNRTEGDYLHVNYVAHSRIYCWPLETFASKSLLNKNDLQRIHNLCPKMGNDLESSREISTHHSLPRKEKNRVPPKQEFLKPRRSRQRKTIPYQTISTRVLQNTNQTRVDWLNTVAKEHQPTLLISIRTWTSSESSNQTQILRSWTEDTKRNISSPHIEDQTLRNFWSPSCTFSLILAVSPQWKYR